MLSSHSRFLLLHPHMLFVGVSPCQPLLPQLLFANRLLLLFFFFFFVFVVPACLLTSTVCVFYVCFLWFVLCLRDVPRTPSPPLPPCSSDSSDSRLPIIRRGEGSMEETYDESFADEREYHDDTHSLSSDM